jgi:hypothetical protein
MDPFLQFLLFHIFIGVALPIMLSNFFSSSITIWTNKLGRLRPMELRCSQRANERKERTLCQLAGMKQV